MSCQGCRGRSRSPSVSALYHSFVSSRGLVPHDNRRQSRSGSLTDTGCLPQSSRPLVKSSPPKKTRNARLFGSFVPSSTTTNFWWWLSESPDGEPARQRNFGGLRGHPRWSARAANQSSPESFCPSEEK